MAGLIIVHALNLACGALALGIAALLALAVVPTVGRERAADEPLARVVRHLIWLAWIAIGAELVSGVLWLLLQAASISGGGAAEAASAQVVAPVLMRTRFGHVLLLRFALALVFALCLALLPLARHPQMRVAVLSIAAAIAGSGLAALAWAGHAVTTPGNLHLLADAIHLLAAGLWLGGLAVLVVLFAAARRPADGAWLILLGATTRRFSLRAGLKRIESASRSYGGSAIAGFHTPVNRTSRRNRCPLAPATSLPGRPQFNIPI